MINIPKWLRARPRKLPNASDPLQAPVERPPSSHSVGTNINNPVVDIYRPHIRSGDCLIATGYQDFLSSLAILLTEVPELRVNGLEEPIRIRIAFGVDTGNTSRIGRSVPVSEEIRAARLTIATLRRKRVKGSSREKSRCIVAQNTSEEGETQDHDLFYRLPSLTAPESIPPEPNRFVADVDPTLVQEVFDVAKRKWKPDIQHHR